MEGMPFKRSYVAMKQPGRHGYREVRARDQRDRSRLLIALEMQRRHDFRQKDVAGRWIGTTLWS